MLSITQLEVLLAVIDEGGFSGAARSLYMSQPSVSNHVRNLESTLGVQLVQRTSHGARPTPAGETTAAHAREVLARLEDLGRAAAEHQGVETGRLAVAGTTTLGTYLLPRLVGQYNRRAPNVACRVLVGNQETVEGWVVDRSAAVGLAIGMPHDAQLHGEPLFEERLLLVAPAGSAWSDRTVGVDDLAGQRFLVRERGSATRSQQQVVLDAWGLGEAEKWELWGADTVKEGVQAGLGLALVSEHAVARELATGTLVALDLADVAGADPAATRRTVSLLQRADAVLTPPEELFVTQVRATGSWPEPAPRAQA